MDVPTGDGYVDKRWMFQQEIDVLTGDGFVDRSDREPSGYTLGYNDIRRMC